jgi:hypothetical protein
MYWMYDIREDRLIFRFIDGDNIKVPFKDGWQLLLRLIHRGVPISPENFRVLMAQTKVG